MRIQLKKWIGVLCLLSVSLMPIAQADTLVLKKGHPQTYVVKKGDTLWDISATFLEDAWRWPKIWKFNPHIDNPHLIYPGDTVKLTWVNGEPRLVIASRDKKLSPRMRASAIEADVDQISLESISKYLSGNRLVDKHELKKAPYVVSGREGRLIMGAGDVLYARGELDENNTTYGIYRAGEAYFDNESGELLGYEAVEIGAGTVVAIEDGIASISVSRAASDIRIKDRLLPLMTQRIDSTFFPKTPENPIEGEITAVVGGVTQVGQYNVVVLNKGAREEVAVGDLLSIFKEGLMVEDALTEQRLRLPAEKGGMMMVYRVFEKMSYALVLEASRTLAVGDLVKSE